MDSAIEALFIIVAALVLCGILFRLVMRGKWVAWSHPICSACGHNLTGLPVESTNCPECGGELAKVRKNSVKRKRWAALGCATVLTLIWLVILGTFCFAYIDRVPTFALMPFRKYQAIERIIFRRLENHELSAAQEAKLVDEMIATPPPWPTTTIEDLRREGRVTDAQWQKYATWATEFPIAARGTIAQGDPLVIQVLPPFNKVVYGKTILKFRGRMHVTLDDKEIPMKSQKIEPGTYDVIFRPDARTAAMNTITLTQIVDGEFVVHNAEVANNEDRGSKSSGK